MKFLVLAICLQILVTACGVGHHPADETGLMIASSFPFDKNTKYYDDVQLVSKQKVNNVWEYQFIAAIVDVDDENALVNVEVKVVDAQGNLLCPRFYGNISRNKNHIELPDCNTDQELDSVSVKVSAGPQEASRKLLRTHKFDLTQI